MGERDVPRGPVSRWAPVVAVVLLVALRLILPAPGEGTALFRVGEAAPEAATLVILGASGDATIDGANPETNYGAEPTLVLSWDSEHDFQRCVMLKFSVAGIPTDATVLSAQLNLRQTGASGDPGVRLSLFHEGAHWVEDTVDWNAGWPPGPLLGWTDSALNAGIHSWTIPPAEVQSWLTAANEGFMLCGEGGPDQTTYERVFDSDESTAGGHS